MQDIPKMVNDLWEKGLEAKNKGLKEKAMKQFLNYYDTLKIYQKLYNLNSSHVILAIRFAEVTREIRELIQDEDYLRLTILPRQGIAEIRAAMGFPTVLSRHF